MKKVEIVLVGCGGTGGCLFGRLIRFLADQQITGLDIKLTIVDGDHVEMKNLGRQPFLAEDVGNNKAVALASAAEETLGLHVKAFPEYLAPENMGRILGTNAYYSADVYILIGAVDNHACRKLMHQFFAEKRGCALFFYIDAANEYHSGDVVFAKKAYSTVEAPDRCHYFPEVLTDTDKPAYEKSCEELNISEPQHLATNSFAADMIFGYVVQLLCAGEMMKAMPGGIAYFDAFKLFSRFDSYGSIESMKEGHHEENE